MVAIGQQGVRFPSFEIVAGWLNSARPNFVDNNPDDHTPDVVNGCTTCFIYYLHYQIGASNRQTIAAAGAPTLGGVYTNLTRKSDGWPSFINLVNTFYPQAFTYNPAGDRIFPVAHLSALSDTQIPSGTTLNARILSLDTQALAEVPVSLTSDKPAVLSVPAQFTFPVGDWAAGVNLTAAPVTGPKQTVNIHATYAGKTLSSLLWRSCREPASSRDRSTIACSGRWPMSPCFSSRMLPSRNQAKTRCSCLPIPVVSTRRRL